MLMLLVKNVLEMMMESELWLSMKSWKPGNLIIKSFWMLNLNGLLQIWVKKLQYNDLQLRLHQR